MKRASKPFVRIIGLCAAEALLAWGLLWGIRQQTAEVNRTVSEISDLKDPSPFRAALMGHLGKIHLGLEAYLRSPDPTMEKQIATSRKDFESLLPEFMQQNPKLFPPAAGEEIKRVFALFKEASDHTLQANAQRMERRGQLEHNFAQILYLIDHNVRPLIRKNQADGDERSDSILNIENQTRAWQQNLDQAWEQPSEESKGRTFENVSRGETYLDLYARMELLSRERKVLQQIRTLWQANSDVARETFVKESIVDQAKKIMEAEYDQVVLTLNKLLPALPPAELEVKKEAIMNAMRLHLVAAGVLGLLGLISFVIATLGIYRMLHKPAPTPDGVYRAPTPTAGEAHLQMDLKGRIISWDSGAETLYGYAAADIQGQSIGKLFESESEIARLGQELKKAKRATFETTHKTKAGTPIPVKIEFLPIADASGRATAIGLTCVRSS